jgi:DNA-binding response OmpR family regulator
MRALLVEDDDTIAAFVEDAACAKQASRSTGSADSEAGFEAAIGQPYDVAVVDLMLPSAMV